MATQAEINEITAKETALLAQIRSLAAKAEELENTIAKYEKIIQRSKSAQARGETLSASAQAQFNEAEANISGLQNQLADVQAQLSPLRAEQGELATQRVELSKQLVPPPQPAPPATASQTAQDDASKGPNATPSQEVDASGRVTNRSSTGAATNADKPPVDQPGSSGETTGTDAPVKTSAQSQSVNTNSNSGQAVKAPGTNDATSSGSASAPIQAGQSAQDDGVSKNTNNTQAAVNATNPATFKVVTQPNVLDQFNSYSYTASVYLLTSDQYTKLLRTKNKRIDGYQLLFQSGGAPSN